MHESDSYLPKLFLSNINCNFVSPTAHRRWVNLRQLIELVASIHNLISDVVVRLDSRPCFPQSSLTFKLLPLVWNPIFAAGMARLHLRLYKCIWRAQTLRQTNKVVDHNNCTKFIMCVNNIWKFCYRWGSVIQNCTMDGHGRGTTIDVIGYLWPDARWGHSSYGNFTKTQFFICRIRFSDKTN